MAINFNPNALDAFRNASLTGEKAIANLDKGTGNIRQAGSYKGAFEALFRKDNVQAENNAVRTELLRSLGQAFGIEGMSEKDGKVTFSDKFMDKLEQILGKDFKRNDFGINADGTVSSGKPLTQRRITAILNRAKLAGKTEFDLGLYEAKLADVKAKLDKMPNVPNKERVLKHFKDVGKIIDFLKTEVNGFITKNAAYDHYKNDLEDFPELKKQGLKPWDMKNAITGKTELLDEDQVGPAITYLQNRVGQLFHLELNAKRPELVTNYIKNEMEAFVKLSIDIFNDSIQADKFNEYAERLYDPGACIEGKTKNLMAFQEKHGLKESIPVVQANEPQIAIDRIAKHDKTTILSDCIFQEIDAIDAKNEAKGVAEFSTWKDYEKPLKDSLVGLERPLVTATKNSKGVWEFTPVLDDNNQPIVKKLTAEDIDRIGPACVEFVTVY